MLIILGGCARNTVWVHRSNTAAVFEMDEARCQNEAVVGVRRFRNETPGEAFNAGYQHASYMHNCLVALGWVEIPADDPRLRRAAPPPVPQHENAWRRADSPSRRAIPKDELGRNSTLSTPAPTDCVATDEGAPGRATIEVSEPAWILWSGRVLGPSPLTYAFPSGCIEVTLRGRRSNIGRQVRIEVVAGETRTYQFDIE